jgi:prophage tail gpP-like protein
MTLEIEVEGDRYSDFIDITVNKAINTFARSFSFTMDSSQFFNSAINVGSLTRIYADGELQVTGYIDRFHQRYDRKSDNITLIGRSKTADLADSTVGAEVEFQGQVNLRTITEELIFQLLREPLIPTELEEERLTLNVEVDVLIDDFFEEENLSEEIGQTYFTVLEKFARKRQVLLTDNENGDVLYTRGKGLDPNRPHFRLLNRAGRQTSNIVSADWAVDHSQIFNLYDAKSQPAIGIIKRINTLQPSGLISGDGVTLDQGVRFSRKLIFVAENSSNNFECQKRSTWEATNRRAKSSVYKAITNGHSFRGRVWDHNELVAVRDDKTRLEANLLIESVRLNQNIKTGSQTTIVCLPNIAYTFTDAERELKKQIENDYSDLPEGVW